jgi:hypothetical protein
MPVMVVLVPPAGGPEPGVIEKMMRCESSEVLPAGSVAVALIREPAATATGRMTLKLAFPDPSVVTWVEPM